MKRLLLFIWLLIPLAACGQYVIDVGNPAAPILLKGTAAVDTTHWYFSNDGDDSKHGHSRDSAKATWTHMLTLEVEAGDKILFAKNDTFRVRNDNYQGNLSWIGTENDPITFSWYGLGSKPIIYGSEVPSSWTDLGDNIWYNYNEIDTFPLGSVWFHELDDSIKWGLLQPTVYTDIDSVNEYYYANDTLYVYSTSDPLTAFTSVEVPQGDYSIFDLRSDQDSAEHYIFDGLEIAYASTHFINCNYPGYPASERILSGITVRNCLFHHNGYRDGNGASVNLRYNDILYENNESHNCARNGAFFGFGGAASGTMSNIVIQDNYFHDGWHTTGPDVINYGSACVMDSIIIRRNTIEDDPDYSKEYLGMARPMGDGDPSSMGTFVSFQGSATGGIGRVYIYNNVYKNVKASAMQIGTDIDSLWIYNNTIYGANQELDLGVSSAIYTSGPSDTLVIKNNIIYSNVEDYKVMFINNHSHADINYNLFFTDYPAADFIEIYTVATYTQSQWSTYKSATSWDANSPTPADPLFYNAPTNLKVNSTSDAVGGGAVFLEYTTDYEGVTVSDPPNIGAYETTED